jgi:hypothetical protein
LLLEGLVDEAAAELRLARENYPKGSPPPADIAQAERLIPLMKRLPAVLRGEDRPADADEAIGLADLCTRESLYAAAARFYGGAFASRPSLAESPATGHRYNAACAAALAASGRGKDDPPPDDAARARLREQARAWLRADLAVQDKVLGGVTPKDAGTIAAALDRWKADADLSGLRDNAALSKLPEPERTALLSLWADVESLRAKAGAKAAPPPGP